MTTNRFLFYFLFSPCLSLFLLFFSPFFPLPVFILHIRHDSSLCCTLINQVWRGLFLTPPPHKQISHSYWPVSLSDPVCFCGIDLEVKPRENRCCVKDGKKWTPFFLLFWFKCSTLVTEARSNQVQRKNVEVLPELSDFYMGVYIYVCVCVYTHTEKNYKHFCFCPHFSWAELKDLRLFLCTQKAYFSHILFTNLC